MTHTNNTDSSANSNSATNAFCLKSRMSATQYEFVYVLPNPEFNNTKEIINAKINGFMKTYINDNRAEEVSKLMSQHALKAKLNKILKDVYDVNPETVALQFTSDSSILFSFTKSGIKVYIEYFPENAITNIDEFVVNAYKGSVDVIDSFSGSQTKIFEKISTELNKNTESHIFEWNATTLSINSTATPKLQIY